MSMVMRALYHLKRANDEWEDIEKRTTKNETGKSTANQDANSTMANEGVMARRSERLDESTHDQAITSEVNSAAARSKEMDSGTTGGGARKRKSGDVSVVLESNKRYTRARMNAVLDVSRNDRSVSRKWKTLNFEERCGQLLAFKDEVGHCNVPRRYSADPSLGHWCNTMKVTYNQMQKGKPTKVKLSQDRIECLEAIGFKWKYDGYAERFEKRCLDLEAFKRNVGHCNVPLRFLADLSLGIWCHNIRCAYVQIQQGKTPQCNLSQDRIERLEEIGFRWNARLIDN